MPIRWSFPFIYAGPAFGHHCVCRWPSPARPSAGTVLIEKKYILPSFSGYQRLRFVFLDQVIPLAHDDVIKWKHFPRYWSFVGEFTGHRWIPLTHASDAELWFFLFAPEQTVSKQSRRWWFETPSRLLWRHCNVMADEISQYVVELSSVKTPSHNRRKNSVWNMYGHLYTHLFANSALYGNVNISYNYPRLVQISNYIEIPALHLS